MVSAIARRMIRDPERARDAAQDAWVAVVAGLETFREESRLSTWVYAVASREILRAARDERVYSTRFLSGFFHGPERELPAKGGVEKEVWVRSMCDTCLTGMLHCLDNRRRLAFILRDLASLDYDEVAAVLEDSPEAVRQQVSRARRRLNHFLRGECALVNPQAPCRCRMRTHVEAVDLPAEYHRLYATLGRANVWRASRELLPVDDFWMPHRKK
jgi:RNA polymerase sigma-70 factor (ECF subfamily)